MRCKKCLGQRNWEEFLLFNKICRSYFCVSYFSVGSIYWQSYKKWADNQTRGTEIRKSYNIRAKRRIILGQKILPKLLCLIFVKVWLDGKWLGKDMGSVFAVQQNLSVSFLSALFGSLLGLLITIREVFFDQIHCLEYKTTLSFPTPIVK